MRMITKRIPKSFGSPKVQGAPAVPTAPAPVPWAGPITTACPKCKNRGWYFKNVLAGQTTTCECRNVSYKGEEADEI